MHGPHELVAVRVAVLVFDVSSAALDALVGTATLATEVNGWAYGSSRDLTGFEDGTENPPLVEAPAIVAVPMAAVRGCWRPPWPDVSIKRRSGAPPLEGGRRLRH